LFKTIGTDRGQFLLAGIISRVGYESKEVS
jgi:hypothetical protein